MSVLTLVLAAPDGSRKTYSGTVPVAAGQAVQFSDFAAAGLSGLLMAASGLVAPGVTYSMRPTTSTKAAVVVKNGTNNASLMRSQAGITGAKFSGFTLRATPQGHLYNGITFDHQTNATISNVKVVGVPGSGHEPPGETFPVNDWHGNGNHYSDIEIDGQGVSAASFGGNSSANLTIDRLNAHDCPYSRPAFWLQSGYLRLNSLISVDNWGGINVEQPDPGLSLRMTSPVLRPLDAVRAGGASGSGMHMHLNGVAGDCKDIVITDPDTGGVPFRLHCMDGYKATTDPVTKVVTYRQSQKTMPTILRNGVPLVWLDANKDNGWGVALKDPMKYAVRFH